MQRKISALLLNSDTTEEPLELGKCSALLCRVLWRGWRQHKSDDSVGLWECSLKILKAKESEWTPTAPGSLFILCNAERKYYEQFCFGSIAAHWTSNVTVTMRLKCWIFIFSSWSDKLCRNYSFICILPRGKKSYSSTPFTAESLALKHFKLVSIQTQCTGV